MILLNVKYKCTESFVKDDFYPFIFDWIVNTKDLRYHMDLQEQDYDNYQVYEYQKKKLYFVDYSDAGILAAYHTDTDLDGTEWKLSVVFKPELHELYVQMSNSETTETGRYLRKFKKPDLIDELVDMRIIRKDGCIKIQYESHDVENGNLEEIEKIIEGSAGNVLPVIFLSTTPYGYYAADPEVLADRYAGMAHVFTQRDEEVSYILKEKYGNRAAYGGSIVTYFPVKSLQPNVIVYGRFDDRETNNRISKGINFYYKSQNYGQMTTYDEISSIVVSGRNKNLISQNEQIIEESQKIADENRSIVETFDVDLKKTDEENNRLKQRIADLETENRILKERLNSINEKPLLVYGKEEEVYPGEIKELLINILESASLKEGSRRADIINDILCSNQTTSSLEERYEELRSILNNYRGLDQDQINRLEKLGFKVTSDGKHHKLTYHDDRYIATLAKTSSDVRSGKNAVSLIIKNMM